MQKKSVSSSGVNYAPWEKTFSQVLTPFEEFIHRQTTSSLLLMMTGILALILANSSIAEHYLHLIHLSAGLSAGNWSLNMSLHHWVNDGLMAFFFFVVGLELKRELLAGELSNFKQAALPVFSAIGGMLVPALIYIAFNANNPQAVHGWGIPMATDIAFAVGVLALLANRVPKGLITFLVALAIADDLGAVIVIALFYTQSISTLWLGLSALITLGLITLNFAGIRKLGPYFIFAALLWYALLQSGVHATLAGVIGAFSVPARSKYDPSLFISHIKNKIHDFEFERNHLFKDTEAQETKHSILSNEHLYAITSEIEHSVKAIQTPLQREEHFWHLPVAFVVIPIFAFFNAGIPIELKQIQSLMTNPIMLGVSLGLVLGKTVGISGAAWLALKLKLGELPKETSMPQLVAVSVLGGIGFTMSIFIAELAFANQAESLLMAKTGILLASLMAGLIGYCALFILSLTRK